jgi:hypothetical protein
LDCRHPKLGRAGAAWVLALASEIIEANVRHDSTQRIKPIR